MRTAGSAVRLVGMAVVGYNTGAGLMSSQVDGDVYALDADDLSLAGAVLLRPLAEERPVTPDMIPVLLHREP